MLRGSKALVTGASRGIGYAIAKELVSAGAAVTIVGRNTETIEKAARELGENVQYLTWDVAELERADELIASAAERMGGLDILVNNAGIFAQRGEWTADSLLQTTVDEWERVMRINTSAIFCNMGAAVRYFRAHGIEGNILNVTSVAGAEPVFGAYGASKIAATGLTRGWGKMFAPEKIVINGIAPGPVATEMNHWHDGDPMENSRIPFGRYATIEEVGKLAMYLLDECAVMTCGEVVTFDGGYAIR